ncbi:hypothetical protein IFR05_005438 [Cadophora sp. M221]|nr:hypothetical protein IFR05_005438 [Cadophora sp. M221]
MSQPARKRCAAEAECQQPSKSKRRRSRSTSESNSARADAPPPAARVPLPPPSAHDLDQMNYHIGLQEFGTQLQHAANAIFPGDQISRYTQVDVILLCWEDEDPNLPVSLEIEELADVFAKLYGFNVEKWSIPSEDCHIRVQTKILQFLEHSDSAHLKIVYYGGHGRLTNHGQSAWTRRSNKPAK